VGQGLVGALGGSRSSLRDRNPCRDVENPQRRTRAFTLTVLFANRNSPVVDMTVAAKLIRCAVA